jgi:hypothetical protein
MCAAAGFSANSSGTSAFGFAEIWNGTAWTADKVAPPNGTALSFLYGVSCRADASCVAVGSAGSSAATKATALAYNGKTWTAQTVPGPGTGTSSDFFGVNCLRANQCVAIGETLSSRLSTAVPLGGLWSGASWRTVAA